MPELLNVRVGKIEMEAKGVISIQLVGSGHGPLPQFSPGAHIDLHLPNGLIRQYSLCNDAGNSGFYLVAVSNALNGRGGSAFIHESLKAGDELKISKPKNNFSLKKEDRNLFFMAGGIGITPIISMIHYSISHELEWKLLYSARSRQDAAFYDYLISNHLTRERVDFHFDDERNGIFDVNDLETMVPADAEIYCCGPVPMIEAVRRYAEAKLKKCINYEFFSKPEEAYEQTPSHRFSVQLARSKKRIEVDEGKTILEALEEHGCDAPFSCREGMCRGCETTVIQGRPDHRDYVLSEEERRHGKTMMICVSRSLDESLILDL